MRTRECEFANDRVARDVSGRRAGRLGCGPGILLFRFFRFLEDALDLRDVALVELHAHLAQGPPRFVGRKPALLEVEADDAHTFGLRDLSEAVESGLKWHLGPGAGSAEPFEAR